LDLCYCPREAGGEQVSTLDENPQEGSGPRLSPEWATKLPAFPPVQWKMYIFEEEGPEWVPAVGADKEVAQLSALEERLGYRFQDRRLLRCALTSPAWTLEDKGWLRRRGR